MSEVLFIYWIIGLPISIYWLAGFMDITAANLVLAGMYAVIWPIIVIGWLAVPLAKRLNRILIIKRRND